MSDGAAVLKGEPPSRYDFTVDWLRPHVAVWDEIIASIEPRRMLEIGCFEGRATTHLIESCSKFGSLNMVCVDTWGGAVDLPPPAMRGVETRFDRNTAIARASASVDIAFRKFKQPAVEALPVLLAEKQQFDFIYVDGSHVAADVLTDAVMAFPMLRAGGCMLFDDYDWCMESHGKEDALNMPRPAIDAFAMLFMRRAQCRRTMTGQFFVIKG